MAHAKIDKPHTTNQHSKPNQSFIQQTALQRAKTNDPTDQKSDLPTPLLQKSERDPANDFIKPNALVQAKLAIGQPNDVYEKEADTVADKVVHNTGGTTASPTSSVQKKDARGAEETEGVVEEKVVETDIQQKSASPALPPNENEETTIQQKSTQSPSGHNIESTLQSSKGSGTPMNDSARNSMESGFGSDFSGVRIHTDSNAVQMNKDLGARAFTSGNDIYFNEGEYRPDTNDGKHLLAHELTHTIQQGQNQTSSQIQRTGEPDPYENYEESFEFVFNEDAFVMTIKRMTRKQDNYQTLETDIIPNGYSMSIASKKEGSISYISSDEAFFIGLDEPPKVSLITDGAIVFETEENKTHHMLTDQVTNDFNDGQPVRHHRFYTSVLSGSHTALPSVSASIIVPMDAGETHSEMPYIPDIPGKEHEAHGDINNALYVRFDSNGDKRKDMLMKMVLKSSQTDAGSENYDQDRRTILFSLYSYDTKETFEKEVSPALFANHYISNQFKSEHELRTDGHSPNKWNLNGVYTNEDRKRLDGAKLRIYPGEHEGNQLRYEVDFAGETFDAFFDYEKTVFEKSFETEDPVYGNDQMAVDLKVGPFKDKLRLVLEPNSADPNSSKLYLFMYTSSNNFSAPETVASDPKDAVPVAPFVINVAPPYSFNVLNSEEKADNVTLRIDLNNDQTEDLALNDRLIGTYPIEEFAANISRRHWLRLRSDKLVPNNQLVMFRTHMGEMKRNAQVDPSDDATFKDYMRFFIANDFNKEKKPAKTDIFQETAEQIAEITSFYRSLQEIYPNTFTEDLLLAWGNFVAAAYSLYPVKNAHPMEPNPEAEALYSSEVMTFHDTLRAEVDEFEKDDNYFYWLVNGFSLDEPDPANASDVQNASWSTIEAQLLYYAQKLSEWTAVQMKDIKDTAVKANNATNSGESTWEKRQTRVAEGRTAQFENFVEIKDKPNLRHIRAVHYPKEEDIKEMSALVTHVPMDIYYWKEGGEWHVIDMTNPNDTYEQTRDVESGEKEPPPELFSQLNKSGHFVGGYMRIELPSGHIYEVETYMAHDWKYYATYVAFALMALGLILTGVGAPGGALMLAGEISIALADVAFILSSVHALEELAAHDQMTFANVSLEIGNIILSAASGLKLGPARILGTASRSERAIFGPMTKLIRASEAVYVPLHNIEKFGAGVVVMALSMETLQQIAALEGKGSDEDMERAGQIILYQLMAAGMIKFMHLKGSEAMSHVTGGKDLMSLEIGGKPCIVPANPGLRKLLTTTKGVEKLSEESISGLMGMSEAKLARLEGKSLEEIESAGVKQYESNKVNEIYREDDFLYTHEGAKPGRFTSYIDESGNLRPADAKGNATVRDHIRGSEPMKSKSPYTSFKSNSGVGKSYGTKSISIDLKKLRSDINSGKLKNVEIVEHSEILEIHDQAIAKAEERFNNHPSAKNREKLDAAIRDKEHSVRDHEILIKGVVPKKYITIINQ